MSAHPTHGSRSERPASPAANKAGSDHRGGDTDRQRRRGSAPADRAACTACGRCSGRWRHRCRPGSGIGRLCLRHDRGRTRRRIDRCIERRDRRRVERRGRHHRALRRAGGDPQPQGLELRCDRLRLAGRRHVTLVVHRERHPPHERALRRSPCHDDRTAPAPAQHRGVRLEAQLSGGTAVRVARDAPPIEDAAGDGGEVHPRVGGRHARRARRRRRRVPRACRLRCSHQHGRCRGGRPSPPPHVDHESVRRQRVSGVRARDPRCPQGEDARRSSQPSGTRPCTRRGAPHTWPRRRRGRSCGTRW